MMFTDTLNSFLMSYTNDNFIGSQNCTIICRSALFLVVLIGLSSLVPVCLLWFKFFNNFNSGMSKPRERLGPAAPISDRI